MKILEGVAMDRAIGRLNARQIGRGSMKYVEGRVSSRWPIDMRSTARRSCGLSLDVLDVYLHRNDAQQALNCWVALLVRFTHPKRISATLIIINSGKRTVIGPLVMAPQRQSITDICRESHILFNLKLSGLVLDEIVKTDLQEAENILLTGGMFGQHPHFLAQKKQSPMSRKLITDYLDMLCCLPSTQEMWSQNVQTTTIPSSKEREFLDAIR